MDILYDLQFFLLQTFLLTRICQCLIVWDTFLEMHFQYQRIWILFRASDTYPYFAPEVLFKYMLPAVSR